MEPRKYLENRALERKIFHIKVSYKMVLTNALNDDTYLTLSVSTKEL